MRNRQTSKVTGDPVHHLKTGFKREGQKGTEEHSFESCFKRNWAVATRV